MLLSVFAELLLKVMTTESRAMHPLALIESLTIYIVVVLGVTEFVAAVDEYPEGEEVHL